MPFFDQYPYTNFHNVNLDWVLERVKEWGQMVEDNNTRFENLQEANEAFKEYVTNYLENLDVQAEIDDKLDRMFESGELTEYLQPYVSNTVTTWLEENITEPVGVVIDSSLTVAGAAADAKAVGDKFDEIGNITDVKNAIVDCFRQVSWFDGTLAEQAFENLLEAFNMSDFYNKWSWTYPADITIFRGTPVFLPNSSTDGIYFSNSISNARQRRAAFVNKGKLPVVQENNVGSDLYPIPIPPRATKVTVTVTPTPIQVIIQKWDLYEGTVYHFDKLVQWQTGTNILEFESGFDGFIAVNLRYNSSNDDFAVEPQTLNILFE